MYLFNRLFERIALPARIVKYYFVAQKLHDSPILPANRGNGIKVSELPFSLAHHPCPRPEVVIKDRYDQGAVCLAAYNKEQFSGCLWYIEKQYREDEVRCLYKYSPDQAVWDFDVYVVPKFRLSPVFLKLWDQAAKQLLEQGYTWSLSRISAFNATSLSSHTRMGAEIVGSAHFICLGQFQLTIANIYPFIHFSKGTEQFPVFNLRVPEQFN